MKKIILRKEDVYQENFEYPHSEIMQKMNLSLQEYTNYLKKFKLEKDCLAFGIYEVSYIEMNENSKEIYIRDDEILNTSGNNSDGIIITKRKKEINSILMNKTA